MSERDLLNENKYHLICMISYDKKKRKAQASEKTQILLPSSNCHVLTIVNFYV